MISTTFRTDDAERWGFGKGFNLEAAEVDRNFWELKTALESAIADPPAPVEIAGFTIVGGGLLITMTSGSTVGPLPFPVLSWRWRGDWLPNVPYAQLDAFAVAGVGLFIVLLDHTAAMTFDAAAIDGMSRPLYRQLIEVRTPSLTVTDGTTTVHNVTQINFTGPVAVTSLGGGTAVVEFIGGGGTDVALLATVTLSSSDILGAHTTPIIIVPAPGAGKAILPLGVFYSYTYNSTTYAAGANAGLYIDPSGAALMLDASATSIVTSASSKAGAGALDTAVDFGAAGVWENNPVMFYATSAFTTGNGSLKINCVYAVVPI
jgi:hypothetical protein